MSRLTTSVVAPRQSAARAAREGYDVVFCYQSHEVAAPRLAKEAGESGVRVPARRADVRAIESVRALVAETEDELGPVTAAVTAAGITRDNSLLMMRDEEWHQVLDVDLDGVYNLCRSVVFSMMKQRACSIVNRRGRGPRRGSARGPGRPHHGCCPADRRRHHHPNGPSDCPSFHSVRKVQP
ncbi:SDR family oxidoreductase [Streptomyces sp. rh34]|uniref:SDR family oxidoreductase n=1 Tax=Streptomyces sp. rh34 TaxID=2034272 RepID=UPI00211D6CE0|nr:SDR family oxidoreductase [Streptomyces sp. rh34]